MQKSCNKKNNFKVLNKYKLILQYFKHNRIILTLSRSMNSSRMLISITLYRSYALEENYLIRSWMRRILMNTKRVISWNKYCKQLTIAIQIILFIEISNQRIWFMIMILIRRFSKLLILELLDILIQIIPSHRDLEL